jgi:hypothetical protein
MSRFNGNDSHACADCKRRVPITVVCSIAADTTKQKRVWVELCVACWKVGGAK